MQLKTVLNRVEKYKSFVFQEARWAAGDRVAIEFPIEPRANSRAICSGCGKAAPGSVRRNLNRNWARRDNAIIAGEFVIGQTSEFPTGDKFDTKKPRSKPRFFCAVPVFFKTARLPSTNSTASVESNGWRCV